MKADSASRHLVTRFVRWFLVTGNRLLVSLVILFGIGVVFFVVAILEIATVTTSSRVMWYLNGTVNGLLTLIPITVGVNQILLSREFGSIQDLYGRHTSLHRDVHSAARFLAEWRSETEPEFVRFVGDCTGERADQIDRLRTFPEVFLPLTVGGPSQCTVPYSVIAGAAASWLLAICIRDPRVAASLPIVRRR